MVQSYVSLHIAEDVSQQKLPEKPRSNDLEKEATHATFFLFLPSLIIQYSTYGVWYW
jgi:hypothetical protein